MAQRIRIQGGRNTQHTGRLGWGDHRNGGLERPLELMEHRLRSGNDEDDGEMTVYKSFDFLTMLSVLSSSSIGWFHCREAPLLIFIVVL